MDAGLELFGTDGYAAASIERLCTTAGVSTRNFYEEFPSRESLLVALHTRINEEAQKAVIEAMAPAADAPFAERVELGVRAYVQSTAGDRRRARLNFVEVIGVSPDVEQHRLELRRQWTTILNAEADRAVERGEAHPRDFHLSLTAFIGAVNELVYHWSMTSHSFTLDDLATELVRLAINTVTT